MAVLTLVIAFGVLFTFTYRGFPYRAWVGALVVVFASWAVSGATPFLFWLLLIPSAALAVVFGVPALRRSLVTARVMKILGPMLPSISETERAALDAGTVWWDGELFSGRPDWRKLLGFRGKPLTREEEDFLAGPVEELCAMLDDWQISHQGDLPPEVWDFIKQHKFMGMIIAPEYGGLGFSAAAHSAVIAKVSSRSAAASVTVMVPNSLGPAELLQHYGTEEQKNYYLPRLATGEEVPAFALTEPAAGSDAASGQSEGTVSRGMYQGEECLGMRLNWNKRYITLGPVATVLGLSFRLLDPEGLLGDTEDLGITVALVPTNVPGIDIGKRHDPLGVAFLNGPNAGEDVFVPIDFIVGGRDMAGQGWRMLMESLAAGRSISLPGLAVGATQTVTRVTSAYASIREQFGIPIGKFEGIQERLARIAGMNYLMNATRTLTADAVDAGEKPAVLSAVIKAYLTEFMRITVNDGMDVLAGAAISRGPRNTLANAYQAVPIGITVEGANILTRNLIIYGQGVIRCHPFVQDEIAAVEARDLARFDKAFFGHMGLVWINATRAFFLGLTNGRLSLPAMAGPVERHFGRLNRWSAAFTLLSDVAMGVLGADLKRKERISARMSDALAWMYLASATLKRYVDEGQRPEHEPFATWALETAEYNIQTALLGVIQNFPNRFVALKMRALIFPLGARQQPPSDRLDARVASALLDGGAVRDDLTRDIYLPGAEDPGLGRLESALAIIVASRPAEKKLHAAIRAHRLPRLAGKELLKAAVEAGILSEDESRGMWDAMEARDDAIQVDAFDPEFLCRPDLMDALERMSS